MVDFDDAITSEDEQVDPAQNGDANQGEPHAEVMQLDGDHFRQNPQDAVDFMAGPDGAVLRAVAMVTASTTRRLIAGHIICDAPERQDSVFLIAPAYQRAFDGDVEISVLTKLAPLLIEYKILGRSDLLRHADAVANACLIFGIAEDHIEVAAYRIVEICTTRENQFWFLNLVELTRLNYHLLLQAIASGLYDLDGHAVIPSVVLQTLCGTSRSDRLWARLRTRSERSRRHALARMRGERAGEVTQADPDNRP